MAKLWQKNYELNELVEEFTVGDDFLLDRHLVVSDCVASIAHAVMLESIGLLKKSELQGLVKELKNIIKLAEKGQFVIEKKDEDCHTAIENHLTQVLGEAGKKIHTGRSRNDQVLAALRLYSRDFMLHFQKNVLNLIESLIVFAKTNKNIPMPGRTHMQVAMPSSLGLWAGAFAEQLLDDLHLVQAVYDINNQSPLGSAASYGVPLPLNRELVSDLLAFKKVQNNVLYVQNSRGKMESMILDSLEQVLLTVSKLNCDIFLYSLPEFGYFCLPDELCTGSSIMPQKKNPDGIELLRAKVSSVAGYAAQVKNIVRNLPSGYNRDSQETKAPFIKALVPAIQCVQIAELTMEKLKVNETVLLDSFPPEIFATQEALDLVKSGMPFRDAYKKVTENLDNLKKYDPVESIKAVPYSGSAGNLKLELAENKKSDWEKAVGANREEIEKKLAQLTGFEVRLFI
ncbi:MAG: argininosuccinate lyase [Spirochaetales bacterium]|nr:argininosuccinate lyase [Spirochaetales bacterium]